jgi:hypothetical protein
MEQQKRKAWKETNWRTRFGDLRYGSQDPVSGRRRSSWAVWKSPQRLLALGSTLGMVIIRQERIFHEKDVSRISKVGRIQEDSERARHHLKTCERDRIKPEGAPRVSARTGSF